MGALGRPLGPDPVMSVQFPPLFVVLYRLSVEKPPKHAYTVLLSAGSTSRRLQKRLGSGLGAELLSTTIHVGLAAVPLVVRSTLPSVCATQMMSELPGATAMADTL